MPTPFLQGHRTTKKRLAGVHVTTGTGDRRAERDGLAPLVFCCTPRAGPTTSRFRCPHRGGRGRGETGPDPENWLRRRHGPVIEKVRPIPIAMAIALWSGLRRGDRFSR